MENRVAWERSFDRVPASSDELSEQMDAAAGLNAEKFAGDPACEPGQ
jgi:hypothetical protein